MRIQRNKCAGLIIDIQERLFPHIHQKEELLKKSLILLGGLQALNIPLLITEQYPKGLGETIDPVKQALKDPEPIEKIAFSCCDEPLFSETLGRFGLNSLIICGIETHVCVLQTVIDLIGMEILPVVVSDCTGSRKKDDKDVALERMRNEGAVITTAESILLELARIAGSLEFKTISALIK